MTEILIFALGGVFGAFCVILGFLTHQVRLESGGGEILNEDS